MEEEYERTLALETPFWPCAAISVIAIAMGALSLFIPLAYFLFLFFGAGISIDILLYLLAAPALLFAGITNIPNPDKKDKPMALCAYNVSIFIALYFALYRLTKGVMDCVYQPQGEDKTPSIIFSFIMLALFLLVTLFLFFTRMKAKRNESFKVLGMTISSIFFILVVMEFISLFFLGGIFANGLSMGIVDFIIHGLAIAVPLLLFIFSFKSRYVIELRPIKMKESPLVQ